MSNKKLSQDTLDKIISGQVKQIPRWHFVVRNIVLWTLGVLCVLAGALTVSLIIFTFANSALSMRGLAYQSFWQHTIVFVPLLWILGSVIFVVLFKMSIRHTKRGYKYSLLTILGMSLFVSLLLGIVFYFLGVSHLIDNVLGQHFRSYHSVERRQARVFDNPEKGTIIGRVIENGGEGFVLMTPNGNTWFVVDKYVPNIEIKENDRFLIIGKKISDDVFLACDVKHRNIMGRHRQMHDKNMQMQHMVECRESERCMYDIIKNKENINIDKLVEDACEHIQTSQ